MQKLPEERISEIVDFAKFLEFQYIEKRETHKKSIESEEKWDKLLAKPKAKKIMRKMAYEALDDYHAGKTTDIAITQDGKLASAEIKSDSEILEAL